MYDEFCVISATEAETNGTTQGNIILKIILNVNTVNSRRENKERENCAHSADGQSI